MTAHDYASHCLDDLMGLLDIERREVGWQEKVVPFAGVWAAMITASTKDFDTAMRCGVVDGVRGVREAAE